MLHAELAPLISETDRGARWLAPQRERGDQRDVDDPAPRRFGVAHRFGEYESNSQRLDAEVAQRGRVELRELAPSSRAPALLGVGDAQPVQARDDAVDDPGRRPGRGDVGRKSDADVMAMSS